MRKLDKLIREAKQAIEFRGHVMTRFVRWPKGAMYKCPCCDAMVVVTTRPMPNDCELTGGALAVNCVGSQLAMYRSKT